MSHHSVNPHYLGGPGATPAIQFSAAFTWLTGNPPGLSPDHAPMTNKGVKTPQVLRISCRAHGHCANSLAFYAAAQLVE